MATTEELLAQGFTIEGGITRDTKGLLAQGFTIESTPSVENLTGSEAGSGQELVRLGAGGLSKIIPFGIGDEVVAGGSAALDWLMGDAGYSEAYDQRLNEVRNYQKAFNLAANETAPGLQTVSEIANALTIPIPNIFSAAKGVKPVLGNIAKATGIGAGFGAAYGAGESEGIESRLAGAEKGAKFGAVTGGVLGTAGEGLRFLGNKLASAAEDLGSKLLGYNTKNPGNPIGFLDKAGKFTKDAGEGVTQVSKKDVARLNLQGFIDDIKTADTPEKVALKLSQFRQLNGSTIGDTVDTLAAAEQKILSTEKIPQKIISTGDDRPDLLARQFVFEPNANIRNIKATKPDFTRAQEFVDDMTRGSASTGARMQEMLNSVKAQWEQSGKTLADLKAIQEKFGLIKKAAFQGNKSAGPSADDLLNNQIYGALADSVSSRVAAVSKAIGKPELLEIFQTANKNYAAAKTFENLAFKASKKFGLKEGIGSITSLSKTGLGTTLAEGALTAAMPALAPVFAAERAASVFSAAAPVQAMKTATTLAPIASGLSSLFEKGTGPIAGLIAQKIKKPAIKSSEDRFISQAKTSLASSNKASKLMPTEKTVDLVKKLEGKSLKAYTDTGGVKTIGYGHTGNGVDKGIITEKEAEELLQKDLTKAESAVLNAVEVDLTPSQLSALTSLVYNVGEGAFKNSTLLKKLNAGDIKGAAQEFDRWVYDNGKRVMGLVNRRDIEKRLFLRA